MRPAISKIIWLAMFLVGLAFLAISLTIYFVTTSTQSDYVESKATIVSMEDYVRNGDTRTRTYIEHEVDGEIYNVRLNEYSSSWQVGQTIDISYDPNDPYRVSTGIATKILLPIFAAVGLLLISIGLAIFFFRRRKIKQIENIKQGQVVWGTLVQTQNTRTRINEILGQRLGVEIVDYRGRRIVWSDPVYTLNHIELGGKVPVYLNGDLAWVDIDSTGLSGR